MSSSLRYLSSLEHDSGVTAGVLFAALESTGCPICVFDLRHQRLLAATEAGRQLLGLFPQPIESLSDVFADDCRELLGLMNSSDSSSARVECNVLAGKASVRAVLNRVADVGEDYLIVNFSVPVTRRPPDQALDSQNRDDLTGLFDRRQLRRCLSDVLNRKTQAERTGVFFIDVDGFKAVNDCFGHISGDRVLVHIAKRLQMCARPDDVLARYGGDEFVLVATGVPSTRVVRRIAKRLSRGSRLVVHSGTSHQLPITTSVGFALSDRFSDPAQIIAAADSAMYRKKKAGRLLDHVSTADWAELDLRS